MAKSGNQKLKMLYLSKILFDKTDDEHGLSIHDLQHELELYDISVDRKTLYDDFETLRSFGMDIIAVQYGRKMLYHIGSRDFQLAELKLLVDTVQAAKFITEPKSAALISKLERLCSTYEARQLHRQVIMSGRVKADNEGIYYNVDRLHTAIDDNRKIRFHYWQWNLMKQHQLRHDGQLYEVSPWGLVWDNENYYLIAYDGASDSIRHFRVDKMQDISPMNAPREGEEQIREKDLASYPRSLFGMFTGESISVLLECRNEMVGVILDRFGSAVPIIPVSDELFHTRVTVIPSGQFFGWLASMVGKITLLEPDSAVEKMRDVISQLSEQYL